MKRAARTVVFATFLAIFLVGAPAVVLYTAGYRYNPRNGHIVRTGVLTVTSTPRGADIAIDGADTGETTPFIFSRMTPGDYTVALTKDGYHAYEDLVTVESGKTSYVAGMTLFAASTPSLLAEEPLSTMTQSADGTTALVLRRSGADAEIWEYHISDHSYTLLAHIRTGINDDLAVRYEDDEAPALVNTTAGTVTTLVPSGTPATALYPGDQRVGPIALLRGTNAIEVRRTDTPEVLRALLPLANYTVAQVDNERVVLTTENHALYLIDLRAEQPLRLSADATAFAWNTTTDTLAWTDGIEVHVYHVGNNTRTFITRQSVPILDVTLDATSSTVFTATSSTLQSFAVGGSGTHTVTLAVLDTLEQCWTKDGATDTLYVVGTVDGVRGIYALALK